MTIDIFHSGASTYYVSVRDNVGIITGTFEWFTDLEEDLIRSLRLDMTKLGPWELAYLSTMTRSKRKRLEKEMKEVADQLLKA